MAVMTGERRIVSVLFADIVNSTGIGERLGPERSKFLFDEVMRLMSGQVERYGGTVAQRIGDEVYAVFGAPLAYEDDSERAVRAALAIQRALEKYSTEVEAAYGVGLSARIAINTGSVVIHPESEDPYNALGDTVNVAARIQELAEPGGIVVGRTTKSQVDTCFVLEELGEQELRGRGAPVETFRVVGVLESGPVHPTRPLVGRDFELTVLERTMDGLLDGRGAIVAIMGEPGIGKTRLVAEIRRKYEGRIQFVEGRGVSYAQTFPYWPVRDLLREWLGLGATVPEARVRLELKAELATLFGDEAQDVYPFIASLMGLTLEPEATERLRELNRESAQHQTFEIFTELVSRLAAETPLCLVFEDLHWADESTLELLESLLNVTDEASVTLFFLYRTEREHGSWRLGEWARQRYPHRYREIELRPLASDASRTLAGSVAEGVLPESVADLLAERAGGNPFFLEEALKDLVERGALLRDNGGWRLTIEENELAIPTLVQGALQARLDRIEPDTRDVLSIAAVIGRTFGMPLLEELVPHEQLAAALSELQRLDLIEERRRRPHPEYRFRHGLVQEVAYTRLIEPKRRKLHGRVGDALAKIDPEAYALLARHFAEADEPEKAADYLLRAGDAARALYADQEAIRHYQRARDFLVRMGDERRARDTLFKMALAHHLAFDFEQAEEAYDEAFCCRVPPSPRLERTERIETGMELHLDELVHGDSYTTESAGVTELLFRGLLTIDRELSVTPALADNFRVSGDGLEYLFRIREEMRWSDGVPVTAEDFVYTWRRLAEEQAPPAVLMEDISEAVALDERTLAIRLREPRGYFPYILASPWSFPTPRHKCEELGDAWRKPENLVCNGPFVLAEYSEEHALLAANPHWHGPHGNVREIHVLHGLSNQELSRLWLEGRFDILQVFDPAVIDAPNSIAETIPGFSTHLISYRTDTDPFSNAHVRRAFSHALDRERLVGELQPLATPAIRGGAIPPAVPGHSHRIAPEYDLELARRLLADAGYPDGRGLPELEFVIPPWLPSPQPFLDQWAALGARMKVSRARTHATLSRQTAHLWLTGWTVDYPDPDGFYYGFFAQRAHYRDDELMELIEQARALHNQNERMRLYHEIDRLYVAERAAILPVFYGKTILVRRPWVEELWANPMTGAHLDQTIVNRPG